RRRLGTGGTAFRFIMYMYPVITWTLCSINPERGSRRLYRVLTIEKKNELNEITNTNWKFEDDLGSKFVRLKEIDSSSAYFRYPTDKKTPVYEREKSAFQEATLQDVMALAEKNQVPMKSMKVMALIGEDTQVFIHDDSFTEETMNLLADVAEKISTCHFALMNELGGDGLG
ncbi:hypothetical protein ACO0LB_20000, partial [Undibacterium sp. SXout7W]|uniref:hypothetical protein n=1 Tax=Undibacterium sp. SXout7W TaxID=3413049 RepID=UPI003BF14CDA